MPQDALTQIQALETRIRQLRGVQLDELNARLHAARCEVSELERELAKLTGQAPSAGLSVRAPRLSSEEVRRLVLKALAETPTGLSQAEVAQRTGLKYPTVAVFLKKNPKAFKTTGSGRSKRYFLK